VTGTVDTRRDRVIVGAAAVVTVAIGLIFVFVRAPHPWGREGFDCYYDLGLRLARGEPFPTTDVPWGYAYFLAFFYRLAGDRPWVPLVAQVLLNGLVPIFLYRLARAELGRRVALIAALLISVISLNTVYASTQSSDAVCTVIVLASVVLFGSALRSGRIRTFVASGALAGLAPQFRPNLILLPVALAAMALIRAQSSSRRVPSLVLYLSVAGVMLLPWIGRNYKLTGEVLPTSTHGGVQLWYGTLQTGRHLKSRVGNPKSLFEDGTFSYTSLADRPLTVSLATCSDARDVELYYWTDRDAREQRAEQTVAAGESIVLAVGTPSANGCRSPPEASSAGVPLAFRIPGQPNETVLYYYFRSRRLSTGNVGFTPSGGHDDPFIYFVDNHHLADLDRHHDLIDMFDVVRALRAIGFGERRDTDVLDVVADGRVDERDLRAIVNALMVEDGSWSSNGGRDVVDHVTTGRDSVALTLVDGSSFTVPREWRGLATDVSASGGLAGHLCYTRRRVRSLARRSEMQNADRCLDRVRVNEPFYLAEPHRMRRYTALALDNIRSDPGAFAVASAYRAVRLFVVEGSPDPYTAVQFEHSAVVYRLATLVSALYALVGAIGAIVAIRQRRRVWVLLTPLLYVPLTICFVLINMRYSVTVQPYLIAFAAVAVSAMLPRDSEWLPAE
jgi:dolichyl-phosphate-mannose-protein mannosyltransferase